MKQYNILLIFLVLLHFLASTLAATCQDPLGMKSKRILDSQITASSESLQYRAAEARRDTALCWMPHSNDDVNPWIQVNFLVTVLVQKLLTQGRPDHDSWITNYTLSYLDSGSDVQYVTGGDGNIKEFTGNTDRNTPVEHSFTPSIHTRSLRIIVLAYHQRSALRLEIFGCHIACLNPKRLGVSNPEIISDSQMFASTEVNHEHGARWARLNLIPVPGVHHAVWLRFNHDTAGWLAVDFVYFTKITSILTQGRASTDHWMTSFKVSSSVNGINYEFFLESGTAKIFTGNSDRNTIVENNFSPIIFARFVRVHPLTAYDKPSIRVEYKGCSMANQTFVKSACLDTTALGMESGLILNRQLSASSSNNKHSRPKNGRLKFKRTSDEYGGWMATSWDNDPWFMVDFLSNVTLTRVKLTQPDNVSSLSVKKFEIDYGNDGVVFEYFRDGMNKKVFSANDQVKNFHQSIFARFVRIRPTECDGKCAMRTEFYGCYEAPVSSRSLGMENNEILDSQITASTDYGHKSAARFARLNLKVKLGVHHGCWIREENDINPWLQVDFVKYAKIIAIEMQGRPDVNRWIKTYTVSYSRDEQNFQVYEEFGVQKVFIANLDKDTVVRATLSNTILAKYIRIHPKTWEQTAALRVEFIGAYIETNDCSDPQPLGMVTGLIEDEQITSSSKKGWFTQEKYARLDYTKQIGWIPDASDNNPWLQVDLIIIAKLTMIETQGEHGNGGRLFKNYTLAYNRWGTDFEYYKDASGHVKTFQGNVQTDVIVRHYFFPRIIARRIRLYVGNCASSECCIRIELWGCYEDCVDPQPMGIENGDVKNSQIIASSKAKSQSKSTYGRLNHVAKAGVSIGGWMPNTNFPEPHWWRVDFLKRVKIAAVLTQGRQDDLSWTRTFKMCFSNGRPGYYACFRESGKLKIFSANRDSNTIVKQTLSYPIFSSVVRLFLESWDVNPVLRVEFLGCIMDPVDECLSSPCQDGVCEDGFESFTCICSPGFRGKLCETDCMDPIPLGMSNGHISDDQISRSSQISGRHDGSRARLNTTTVYLSGSWLARPQDTKSWLQVDFLMHTVVNMVTTQGRWENSHWTETYALSYSDNGVLFTNYSEGGERKVFPGNVDRSTRVNNTISTSIVTRFLRIHLLSCYAHCALRAEFYGCYLVSDCSHPRPLGMENGYIKDHQLTASSVYDVCCVAVHARLDNRHAVFGDSWRPGAKDTDSWLRVDLIANTSVSGIMTQGGLQNVAVYILNYTLSYSTDGGSFHYYLENDASTKIFEGNTDSDSIVTHNLAPVMVLNSIQIHPKACNIHCALRVEFLGCYKDIDVCQSQPCQHGSTCNEYFHTYNTFNCTCVEGYTGHLCEIDIDDCLSYPCQHGGLCKDSVNAINCTCANGYTGDLCQIDSVDECLSSPCRNGVCEDGFESFTCICSPGFRGKLCEIDCMDPVPLGMSNGHISDDQISRSSQKSSRYDGHRARLNAASVYLSGSWVAGPQDTTSWLQVDFLMHTVVNMVTTQGRWDFNHWTETYALSYSDNGVLFTNYSEGGERKVFPGNVDRDTRVRNNISTPIVTHFLRIHPLSCYAQCALRAEFYGCYLVSDCSHPRPLGMENGYIKDHQLTASSSKYIVCCVPARARFSIRSTVLEDSWRPGARDTDSWLRVDLIANTSVSGIMTQGGHHQNVAVYILNYTLSYSTDGESFHYYLENDASTKIFEGNTDGDSIVTHNLAPVMVLNSIQIHPKACNTHCALRVEFLGCYKDIDVCQSQPCQHGSTCNEYFHTYNTFNCTCVEGYTGHLCEIDSDDCLSYPCQHGGLCKDSVNAINCTCGNGYTGDLCEIDPGPCSSDPCQNSATCTNTSNGFNCTCALGYYGELCSERDHCIPYPCFNNATCTHNATDFKCNCSDGYDGDVCDLVDWCYPKPCLHNGNCSMNETSYECACPFTYTGDHCQTENHTPITDLAVEPIPSQEFGNNISITWSVSDGTYLSVVVLYNTIPCCNSSAGHFKQGSCICAVSDPDLYDPDGVVDITVVARNLVSSPNTTFQIEVLKKIRNASIITLTTYSDFRSAVEGAGNPRNTFPAEYPVKFDVTYLDAPVNVSEWTFICTEFGTSYEYQLTFEKTFHATTSDACDIYLVLRNSISQARAYSSIVLKESVILTSLTSNGPVKPNETITFTISLQKLGTQTCLWFDLDDNSALHVFGDDSCPGRIDVDEINPNILAEPRLKYTHKYSDTQEILINHVYPRAGSYDVRMYASNDVSMVTEQLVAVVVPLECRNPNVTILGLKQNSSNVLNAVQVYSSVDIVLTTEQEIYCEITEQTTVSWNVYKFTDDPRNTVPAAGLRKTLFHSEISTTNLLLPGRFLSYGFYEIVAHVEMRGLHGVLGSASMHVQVVQTPWLEAAVKAGSFYTVPYGFEGSLNASASRDPDFAGTDGMTFAWLCRDVDDSEFLLSNLNNESLISIPNVNDSTFDPAQGLGGCFGSGRGRLNSTDLVLKLDTKTMTEDETYTISLVVSTESPEFGPRQDIVNIFFYVARGLPPQLSTSCSKNCREKVIPDEKVILTSSCSSYCYGQLSFIWALYMYDDPNTPEPFNLTYLNTFSPEEFQNMASNPINQLDIAIRPNSLEIGRKYIIAFRAARPSGVYGELRFTMLVNSPPVRGKCSFFPSSGIAMKTSFTISCEKWNDPDAPLTYEFSYQSNGVRIVYSYLTAPPGEKVTSTDWLPIGDHKNNFELIVTVQAKDKFGSKTKQYCSVKVLPPPEKVLNMADLQNLVTGGESPFAKLNDLGQSGRALSLASCMGAVLNHLSKDAAGNGTNTTLYDKDVSKQIRLQLLTSISQQNTSIVDISSLEQTTATVITLTENTDELVPEAKDAALGICGALTDSLKTLSDNDVGFENVQRGASNLVKILGPMSDSLTNDKAKNSTESKSKVPKQVKFSVGLVDKIQSVLLDNIVATEGPVNVETDSLSLQVEKVTVQDFGQKKNSLKNSEFKAPSPSALGLEEIAKDPNNTFLHMQPINIKMAVFNKNPFSWDNTSEKISSNVVDVVLTSTMNISTSNFSEDASIKIARDPSQFPLADSFYLKPNEKNLTSNTKDYLKYHCFTRRGEHTSMNFELHPEEPGIRFKVYLKKGGKPNVKDGDFMHFYEVPDLSYCSVDNEDVFNSKFNESEGNSSDHVQIESKNCLKDPYTVFVSNVDFNGTGEYCFAIQYIHAVDETDGNPDSRRRKRSVSCEVGARRVRRSCVIIPPAPPKPTAAPPIEILVADNLGFDGKFFFPNQTPNYNLTMFESSCVHWNVENETWTGEGCRVAPGTNKEKIVCYCNHLTSFGSDLLVAPNPIDFDSVFKNFGSLAENVAVLALISTILGVYIIGVIWARRADKRDLLMVGPTILSKPKGSYHYLITTYTGSRQGAGTTARVVFKMNGDEGDTQPVRLRDRQRPCFERGQENAFVVSYPQGIGDLTYLQIWHDNTGPSPSWYLSRMSIKDLQTGKTWPLFCENWLAVESEDGKVCRILSVANEQEMVSFGHLFSTHAIKGLADGHIWFSIVSRPPTSNFTRVQRLSCALCLLCCTMITSAMFYNMGGQGPSPFAVHIGSLVIDLKPFVIGLQSSIIIVPVNVLLVQIFRNLRPKKTKVEPENSEVHNNVENKIKEDKPQVRRGKLPHWFIYPAYALCYLASAASIFFTLLYSIQWGKETSTEWVIAMVTSFFQSVLLLQPVKVVVVAVVFALIIKKPSDTEEESNDVPLVERKVKKDGAPKKMKKYYSPPNPVKLRKAREKRLKGLKMNAALKEIFTFFVFLILLMDVAQYHRDPNTFFLTKTLSETFDEVDDYSIDLAAVSDTDSLWMWSRETLIPGLYATEWYNGKKMNKGWLANMEIYLVGVPRVRTLRVEEDSCTMSNYVEDMIPHCYSGYSVANEDDGTYNIGWEPLDSSSSRKRRDISNLMSEVEWFELITGTDEQNGGKSDHVRHKRAMDPISSSASGRNRRKKKRLLASKSPKVYTIADNAVLPDGSILSCLERWRHQTMIDLRGFPYWGTITMYSGSGYVANLGYDQVTAYTVVSDLHSNGWIDVQTRAVFVEFTVYNANTNLFGIISIFIEFPPSSGAVTKVQFEASRFYIHLTGGQTLAHVLVIFFMMYFLYREGKLVYKQRWAYFKGFWNWVEVILIISEFLLIVLFLARLYEVDRNLLQLRENPNDYVGFQYAANVDALMTYVIGVLVFFYILRFLRLLRFNKNFLVIGKTLSRISAPILSFCLPFIAGFFAFALLAFSMFGSELEDYSSFIRTMVTQFSMTLGDFDFEAIFMVNPTVATLYFFSFIGLNVMVLMNMFIAIINDSYAEIQEETADIDNEFEIIEYVTTKLTNVFPGHGAKVAPAKKKKRKHKQLPQKATPNEQFSNELDLRGKRLENVLDSVERCLAEDELVAERLCSVPKDKQHDLIFIVLCLME